MYVREEPSAGRELALLQVKFDGRVVGVRKISSVLTRRNVQIRWVGGWLKSFEIDFLDVARRVRTDGDLQARKMRIVHAREEGLFARLSLLSSYEGERWIRIHVDDDDMSELAKFRKGFWVSMIFTVPCVFLVCVPAAGVCVCVCACVRVCVCARGALACVRGA